MFLIKVFFMWYMIRLLYISVQVFSLEHERKMDPRLIYHKRSVCDKVVCNFCLINPIVAIIQMGRAARCTHHKNIFKNAITERCVGTRKGTHCINTLGPEQNDLQLFRYRVMFSFLWYPDSKVHGASMGPILGRQDPGGPHVGPINFAIWVYFKYL